MIGLWKKFRETLKINIEEKLPIVCHSGGAEGADMAWENMGKKYGVLTRAYSFNGHKTESSNPVILSSMELNEADPYLLKANEVLKRKFPTDKEYVNNLLRRNYYQIKNGEVTFAIGYFDLSVKQIHSFNGCSPDELNIATVKGGTGWAVQMSVDMNKPIYIFDPSLNNWFYYDNQSICYRKYNGTPNISAKDENGNWTVKNFAGIGTRTLTEGGFLAIRWVYERTFNRDGYWKKKI